MKKGLFMYFKFGILFQNSCLLDILSSSLRTKLFVEIKLLTTGRRKFHTLPQQYVSNLPIPYTQNLTLGKLPEVPFHLYAATAKNGYRKPMPGMWYALEALFRNEGASVGKIMLSSLLILIIET